MPETWYEPVPAASPLLQGDFVLDCPVLIWKPGRPNFEGQQEHEVLANIFDVEKMDVVVMTQSCDLEQRKVQEVVVCPMDALSEFKTAWEGDVRAKGQVPTAKAWTSLCKDIRDGFQWNYAMLNRGEIDALKTEHRIVDFHEIFTLPLEFLEGIAIQRGPRLRLCSPYREHLSQAFARYFMRVGLPSTVETVW